jgi:DnaK suppressor protein
MNEQDLARFRALLEQQKRSLLQQSAQMIAARTGRPGERVADAADMAEREERRNFELRIRDRERKLLGKIERVLEKINNGTFGYCESCDQEIDLKRLEARPVAGLCIECKQEQEDQEQVSWGFDEVASSED